MGTIKQGILGGFSGKVGSVIGGNWKGISHMRSRAQTVKNPKTEGQVGQRTKFSSILQILQAMGPLINIGFKDQAKQQTPFNAAMSYNLKNGVIGDAPTFSFNEGHFAFSRGKLLVPQGENYSLDTENTTATFTWTDNSGEGNALATDKAILLAYSKTKGESYYTIGDATRADATADLVCPSSWSGEDLYLFMSFMSEDGKLISNSVSVGVEAF